MTDGSIGRAMRRPARKRGVVPWDRLWRRPSTQLVIGLANATTVGVIAYALFLAGSVATTWLDSLVQPVHLGARYFWRLFLEWGGVFSGAGSWIAVTYYEWKKLVQRARGSVEPEDREAA